MTRTVTYTFLLSLSDKYPYSFLLLSRAAHSARVARNEASDLCSNARQDEHSSGTKGGSPGPSPAIDLMPPATGLPGIYVNSAAFE